ncbi:GntR family transcriptional regulator [Zoogloea sp.]|uniref:GntR family transcriptional regulator n=1 Tax=Zoogloea sp. TaxID=49181 RepID=UPI0025CE8F4F|nr:GntR family transcriptional regulator [Zoogloea sp.]MCK6393492.1 GntR family transcriptional regulator [Zoogloea sp.]
MLDTDIQSSSTPLGDGPLHRRIHQALRERILDGEWPPGLRLPSESALGTLFEVSRITIRQALGALQKEGLIYSQQGRGSFVSRPKAVQNVTRLQGFAEQMGAYGYEVRNRLLALAEVPADQKVASRLGLSKGAPVVEIRRLRLLDREPVSIEFTWLPLDIGRQVARADLALRDIFVILENDCARPLGEADLALDAVAADAELAAHLKLPEGAPLLRVERLTHDKSGQPLDYEFLYFRGDTFQYRFQVGRGPSSVE